MNYENMREIMDNREVGKYKGQRRTYGQF